MPRELHFDRPSGLAFSSETLESRAQLRFVQFIINGRMHDTLPSIVAMLRPSIFALVLCAYSSAQRLTANAKCQSGYEWMYNSLTQSPCDVAYELAHVCDSSSDSNLEPLPTGYMYIGPTPTYSNRCLCSSVYYALLSACGFCQVRDYIGWGWYSTNCTNRYHQVFPEPIPVGLKVQPWAYEDVENGGTFNVTLAQSLRGGVESTRLPTYTPTYTTVPSNNSNVPIIVGVVVGIVVLALVGGLCAFFLIRRRKKRRSRDSSAYRPVLLETYSSDMAPNTVSPTTSPGKLYNPNDPSTYPTMTSIPSSGSPDSQAYRPSFQSSTPSEQKPSAAVCGRKAPIANSYFGATPEL